MHTHTHTTTRTTTRTHTCTRTTYSAQAHTHTQGAPATGQAHVGGAAAATAAPPEQNRTDAGAQAEGQADAGEMTDASWGEDSGAGAGAGPAVDTAAEAIRGAGQRSTGVGTGGESDTSQPRQRCDDTPPGALQTVRTGRGCGSRREAGTRRGLIANGCEATTPANTQGDLCVEPPIAHSPENGLL